MGDKLQLIGKMCCGGYTKINTPSTTTLAHSPNPALFTVSGLIFKN